MPSCETCKTIKKTFFTDHILWLLFFFGNIVKYEATISAFMVVPEFGNYLKYGII